MAASYRPTNAVTCVPFSLNAFQKLVGDHSGAAEVARLNTQGAYLSGYLTSLNAGSLVVESHYVDRHYLEEYSAYYSKSLVQRPSTCARVHVFSGEVTDDTLRALVAKSASADPGEAERVRAELEEQYLGYIVVRPVASVPFGRTVLRPLRDEPDRQFHTLSLYSVHLLGFKLELKGLAFQQQDRAVAACATVAAWTALQRVRRREGFRCPSPHAITEAAVRHGTELRPYPSQGLSIVQISEALRRFGFPPDYISASDNPGLFVVLLNAYLRSGIPVVLALRYPAASVGHAVTVVGYRKTTGPGLRLDQAPEVRLVNSTQSQIYLHDDRLGPYARATIDTDGTPAPTLRIEFPDGAVDESVVECALVPLYPKLRSNARELWLRAVELLPTMQHELLQTGEELGFELFFERSGTYMRKLHSLQPDSDRLFRFLSTAALSRYVGVVRWYVNGEPVLDSLWDTTDTMREETLGAEHLIGLVAWRPEDHALADEFAKVLGIAAG